MNSFETMTRCFMFKTVWENKWTVKAEIRQTEFLAAGEAYKTVLWPIPGFKDKTFDDLSSLRKEA